MSFQDLYKSSFIEFLDSLLVVFNDHSNLLKIKELVVSEKFKIDKHQKYFVKLLTEHEEKLLSKNEILFENNGKSLNLIPTVDFIPLWKKLNDADKPAFWKHLQTLYMIGQQINNPGKDEVQKMMESLQKNMIDNSENSETTNRLDSIMNDTSNPLVNLAMSITDELMSDDNDLVNMNQEDFMRSMMDSSSGGGFQGLMKKVHSKINKKVKDGNLDLETMEGSAKSMMGQLQGIIPPGLIPGINNINLKK